MKFYCLRKNNSHVYLQKSPRWESEPAWPRATVANALAELSRTTQMP